MAFFAVTLETVETARKHPGADRLDLCTLGGMAFQFVTVTSQYQPGDRVLYFPVDSLLPIELQRRLGLEGRLSGPGKNRVKTVRLRGEISQGLVGPPSLLEGLPPGDWTPEAVTRFLGVEKYEPPILFDTSGKLVALPLGLAVYDLEGADRFAAALERMMALEVMVTEKLEGSNFSVSAEGEQVWVNQRQHSIEPTPGVVHSFWKTAEEQGLLDLARTLAAEFGRPTTVYGEFLGPRVQANIYRLIGHEVRLFDIKVGDRFLAVEPFLEAVGRHGAKRVPELASAVRLSDWLEGRSLQQASNGRSLLADTRREGIVIRPMAEEYSPELRGRLILKQQSPEYLEKSEA